MIFSKTELADLWIVEPEKHSDDRGYFARIFCEQEFARYGLPTNFVQANMSHNYQRGTLRGLHFQHEPYAEDKLVRCFSGSIFDVAVDLRPDFQTFRQWFGVELSGQNGRALLVPKGFAHGFITLQDNTLVSYMVSQCYQSAYESGIRWDDSAIGVQWPIEPILISDKDRSHPFL